MHAEQHRTVILVAPATSGLAVASGVIGILCVLGLGLLVVPQLVAVVLGHAATRQTRTGQRAGHGWAITGLVTGYLCAVPVALAVAWLAFGLLAAPFVVD